MIKPTIHYCKWCKESFKVKLHEEETGDFFIICPFCQHAHYRYFENGIAILSDINKRHYEDAPISIRGYT